MSCFEAEKIFPQFKNFTKLRFINFKAANFDDLKETENNKPT